MNDDEAGDSDVLGALRIQPELMGLLYKRHASAVHRYLSRRAGLDAADDLLGEVFVAALSGRKRVVPHSSGSALPWLYGVARNVLRHHFREKPRPRLLPTDAETDWAAIDARLDAQAQRPLLYRALAELAEGERELLQLIAWEQLTPAEAATVLDISKIAARSRLHRARQHVEASLMRQLGVSALEELTVLLNSEENFT